MIYAYVRVSTKGQAQSGNSISEQKQQILKTYPNAQFTVEAASGAKDRYLFNQLIGELQAEDMLVVTKLDRFCRTVKEGLNYIDILMNKGIRIHILNMGLIENTPMGRLIVTNLLAFAEFERSQIIERTLSGKSIARLNKGYKEGRPNKYTLMQLNHALELKQTHSYKQVAEITGISVSTLVRAVRKNKK